MDIKEVLEFPGYFVTNAGDVIGKRGNILKGKITWDGYREVVLSEGKRRKSTRVHRLITEYFIGPCPDDLQVNHIDGDKLNNALNNLEYISGLHNIHHAYNTGLHQTSANSLCGVSYLDFAKMISMYECGFSYREICDYLDFKIKDTSYLGEILSGRKLGSLTGITEDIRRKGQTASKKFTGQDISRLFEMKKLGYSQTYIAEALSMSIAQVSRILNNKRRKTYV